MPRHLFGAEVIVAVQNRIPHGERTDEFLDANVITRKIDGPRGIDFAIRKIEF